MSTKSNADQQAYLLNYLTHLSSSENNILNSSCLLRLNQSNPGNWINETAVEEFIHLKIEIERSKELLKQTEYKKKEPNERGLRRIYNLFLSRSY